MTVWPVYPSYLLERGNMALWPVYPSYLVDSGSMTLLPVYPSYLVECGNMPLWPVYPSDLVKCGHMTLSTVYPSSQVGLDVWSFVGPFVNFHSSCVRTARALARLRGCAGSAERSLFAYVISTIISWAVSNCLPGCDEKKIKRQWSGTDTIDFYNLPETLNGKGIRTTMSRLSLR